MKRLLSKGLGPVILAPLAIYSFIVEFVGRVMDARAEWRTGEPHLSEWKGLWKAMDDAPLMSQSEWERNWDSLRQWLSTRYYVDWSLEWQRHCYVEGECFRSQRTLKISICVPDVLTLDLLKFLQDWLQKEAPLWRIIVPTDNTDENAIVVYPHTIRFALLSENDLEKFLCKMRPKLAAIIDAETRAAGIKARPIAPLRG